MEQLKILIADDETRMRKLLRDFLTAAGYRIVEAENGEKAVELFFGSNDIDLVIMDVMMPVMNGYEAVKLIRQSSAVPVIMLTAKSEEEDELLGFSSGADEYITKPFSPRILTARVEAVLRRTRTDRNEILEAGKIVLDRGAHKVTADGNELDLSFKEFELLDYFLQNQNIALSRENILNNVWNYDYFGDARTIDTHVKKLRAKLGAEGEHIKTIWGIGYKFE